MRRVFQHPHTFVQCPHQDVVLLNISPLNSFFEVPDSAMYDLRCRTGRRARKVTRLQKHRSNSAQLGIQCTPRASRPTANHTQIELFASNVLEFFSSTSHVSLHP